MGILTPIITTNFNGELFILDGYKRYFIICSMNKKIYIPIKIFYYSSEKIAFIKFFKINLFRNYNEIEISNLIKISENYFKDKILTKYILKKLNKKYSPSLIKKYNLLQNLTEEAKLMIINNKLNINVGFELGKFKEKDQKMILMLIKNLKLNSNKQKILIEKIADITRREDLNPSDLINKYFKKFLEEPYAKKIEDEFFKILIKIHSPDYYEYHLKFQNEKEKILKNVNGINIFSPSNYEDEIYKAEIYFKTTEELKEKLKILNNFTLP